MGQISAVSIRITGIVQGVGFRPFIYNLAKKNNLFGWVRNTSANVEIWVEGLPENLDTFLKAIPLQKPDLALIDQFDASPVNPLNFSSFEIRTSNTIPGVFQPISPDISTCPDCLREMNDPSNRRYRYPFINCTNCGPRFTIIKDIPYDRPNTTMAEFKMCPDCYEEYTNPDDRRFHAQPIACPVCGPKIWLEIQNQSTLEIISSDTAILAVQKLLFQGDIVAIKGIGGFHLACDAFNPVSVEKLRQRKQRVEKPFAIMLPNLAAVEQICRISDEQKDLLCSKERPIVILERLPGETRLPNISPRQNTLGVMLPYTPLHELLFSFHPAGDFQPPAALVMTSGNLSEEPIAISNQEAKERLSSIADAFLMHDRGIHIRCDDSVVRSIAGLDNKHIVIRRSRGYAPTPLVLPWDLTPTIGCGAELKNTFCLAKNRYSFVSHHIGDLQNFETFSSFLDGVEHFQRLFHIKPERIAHDLHPDYLSTHAAEEMADKHNIPRHGIQHHHAHIAACMAENKAPADEPVIGIALDGTGYGLDGAIWGGEFLLSTYAKFDRVYHLEYIPLPGGDSATRRPSRIALAYLWQLGFDWDPDLKPGLDLCAEDRTLLRTMLQNKINTPLQSSMGRLFDAVSSLLGVCQRTNYEGQAAIELEALVDPAENGTYPIDFSPNNQSIPLQALFACVLKDIQHAVPVSVCSARFHNALSQLVTEVSVAMRINYRANHVALSGGVWQNSTLLRKTVSLLRSAGFIVYTHNKLPSNDGGISLGQCVISHHQSVG